MSKTFFLASALLLLCASLDAQTQSSVKDFYVETRLAYEAEMRDGYLIGDNSGFKGQWLNLRLDGNISDNLSYSWRHRFTKSTSTSVLEATDWLHLDYRLSDVLSLSAGKQVVAIGGYEYDRAPIDLYYCSEFWNNIPCYQIGTSLTWAVSQTDRLTFQLCNSPYYSIGSMSKLGINALWSGSFSFWQPLWSVNLFQTRSSYMNYVSLGNRFLISDSIHYDIDVMNRASEGFGLLSDWSVMSELSASVRDRMTLFAKFTHDQNKSGLSEDKLVLDGTDISSVSLGTEFYPYGKENPVLKLFAVGGYRFGTNTNPVGVAKDGQLLVQFGLKWRMDILDGIKKIR